MSLKSITGSKRVIGMLNRLGHCVNYNCVEELETEITYAADKKQELTPVGMSRSSDVCTALAFDNFDRFVESLSGKDTLHDTVGIVYQTISNNTNSTYDNIEEQETTTRDFTIQPVPTASSKCKVKRRRAYRNNNVEIEPYFKKPKLLTTNFIRPDDPCYSVTPSTLSNAQYSDFIWMANLAFSTCKDIPMWVGWNAQSHHKEDVVQNVWYLPQINASPTSMSCCS